MMNEGLNERENMELSNTLRKQVELALEDAQKRNFPDLLTLRSGMVLVKQGSPEDEKRPETTKVSILTSPGGNYVLCHK